MKIGQIREWITSVKENTSFFIVCSESENNNTYYYIYDLYYKRMELWHMETMMRHSRALE